MRRLEPLENPVVFDFEGTSITASPTDTIASALVAESRDVFARSIKYHRPRGPFCLNGSCSNCLMRVDGVPNVATCQTGVQPGMRVERQNAFPDASLDIFQATDVVFRSWFNHHEFLAGIPIAERVMLEVARKLAGLGKLPEKPRAAREPAVIETLETIIVGGGAAGLAAARRLTERRAPFVLLEREPVLGGRLTLGAEDGLPKPYEPEPSNVRLRSVVLGVFNDDGRHFVASLFNDRLHLSFFRHLVLALGGHPSLPAFENNDMPGVMAGRAVARLIRRHRVLPGKTIACVGDEVEARALAALVQRSGAEAVAVGATPVRASGPRSVHMLTVRAPDGSEREVACDVVAVCGPVSPAFEMAKAAGANVAWDERSKLFVVETDMQGRTANQSVFACGELRGPMSAAHAAEQGMLAAEAIAVARSAA